MQRSSPYSWISAGRMRIYSTRTRPAVVIHQLLEPRPFEFRRKISKTDSLLKNWDNFEHCWEKLSQQPSVCCLSQLGLDPAAVRKKFECWNEATYLFFFSPQCYKRAKFNAKSVSRICACCSKADPLYSISSRNKTPDTHAKLGVGSLPVFQDEYIYVIQRKRVGYTSRV